MHRNKSSADPRPSASSPHHALLVLKPPTLQDKRRSYQELLKWVATELAQTRRAQTKYQDYERFEQERKIIVSMILELSELLGQQCREKGQIVGSLMSYAISIINQMKKEYDMLSYGQIKNFRDSIQSMEKENIESNEQLRAQVVSLQKDRDHKWKNIYLVVKDNRVLRRQNAKLKHRFREQTWTVKKLEEELIEYKKKSERYQLLLDEYISEEESWKKKEVTSIQADSSGNQRSLKTFISNHLLLCQLEKKISRYPETARRLLKSQLLDLQTEEMNQLEHKIKFIIESLEENNEIYEDYHDYQFNFQPMKLLYTVSVQAEVEREDAAVNTIAEKVVLKSYQNAKVQTKTKQLLSLSVAEKVVSFYFIGCKKKSERKRSSITEDSWSPKIMRKKPSNFGTPSSFHRANQSTLLSQFKAFSIKIANEKRAPISNRRASLSQNLLLPKEAQLHKDLVNDGKSSSLKPLKSRKKVLPAKSPFASQIIQTEEESRNDINSEDEERIIDSDEPKRSDGQRLTSAIGHNVKEQSAKNQESERERKQAGSVLGEDKDFVSGNDVQLQKTAQRRSISKQSRMKDKTQELKRETQKMGKRNKNLSPLRHSAIRSQKQSVHSLDRKTQQIGFDKTVPASHINVNSQSGARPNVSQSDRQKNILKVKRLAHRRQATEIFQAMQPSYRQHNPMSSRKIADLKNKKTDFYDLNKFAASIRFNPSSYQANLTEPVEGTTVRGSQFWHKLLEKAFVHINHKKKQIVRRPQTLSSFMETYFESCYGSKFMRQKPLSRLKQNLHKPGIQNNSLVFVIDKLMSSQLPELLLEDMFVLFAKMLERLQPFRVRVEMKSELELGVDSALKVINYLLSIYFSQEQMQQFRQRYLNTYRFTDRQDPLETTDKSELPSSSSISMLRFYASFLQEIERKSIKSELWKFMRCIFPDSTEYLEKPQIQQLVYVFKFSIQKNYQSYQMLKLYAQQPLPLHRLCLIAHRFGFRDFYCITSYIRQQYALYRNRPQSTKQLISKVEQNFATLPSADRKVTDQTFGWLKSLFRHHVQSSEINYTQISSEFLKFLQMSLWRARSEEQVWSNGWILGCFQTGLKKVIKRRLLSD